MGSQGHRSSDSRPLGPHWFLTSIVLATALVLPAFSLESLLCYYCSMQHKGKLCPNVTSQCLPGQHCSSSVGHYGSIHILSAQGCVDRELCGNHEMVSYRGVQYNVSHTCCCKDECNEPPKSDSVLKKLLRMMSSKTASVNVTQAPTEEVWDSCANYTSTTSTTTVSLTTSQ